MKCMVFLKTCFPSPFSRGLNMLFQRGFLRDSTLTMILVASTREWLGCMMSKTHILAQVALLALISAVREFGISVSASVSYYRDAGINQNSVLRSLQHYSHTSQRATQKQKPASLCLRV